MQLCNADPLDQLTSVFHQISLKQADKCINWQTKLSREQLHGWK